MTEDDSNDRSKPPPPGGPMIYARPGLGAGQRARVQLSVGAAAFMGWSLCVIGLVAAMGNMPFFNAHPEFIFASVAAAFAGLIVLIVHMIRRGWRMFLPGVLIGFGLSILISAGLCAIVISQL